MALINGINGSVNALNSATEKLSRAQQNITKAFSEKNEKVPTGTQPIQRADRVSLESSMVDMITAEQSFKTNVKVVQTQDQVIGTLLDIKA